MTSLGAARASVPIPATGGAVARFAAFLGPGYLVATGYMDPGNWATAIAGGSRFGAALLFVAVMASLMAMVLQALAARLAIATGQDLAQVCRSRLPRPVSFVLWLASEAAIIATDLAEIIGTAIGLELLFGVPLALGVVLTALDVFLILALERFGFRKLEAFVVALLIVIALCFIAEMLIARPTLDAILAGLKPTRALLTDADMLYLALGILGATVMPHNLYLHSGVMLTRAIGPSLAEKREAARFAIIDSTLALVFALLINGSILLLAAAAFHRAGRHDIAELQDAYRLLEPLLGSVAAAKLFAVALIACGVNSTLTATLAGQIVMEGFIRIRLKPATRRLVTRLVAIVPAMAVTLIMGERATGRLLVLSQVILSLALPFAVLPLVAFTASRRVMGELVAPRLTSALAAVIAAVIVALNVKLVWDFIAG
jgi:manganese transport protein